MVAVGSFGLPFFNQFVEVADALGKVDSALSGSMDIPAEDQIPDILALGEAVTAFLAVPRGSFAPP